MMLIRLSLTAVISFYSIILQAASFTADAVQIRGDEVSHAKMYWSDGRVRFEYADQGIPMVQIFDTQNRKVIWLDTQNRVYLEHEMSEDSPLLITRPAGNGKVNAGRMNPCERFEDAECTRLKEVRINGRDTIKWLVTINRKGRDYHVFQWLDSEHGIPVRQENPDGSVLNVQIRDDQEYDGRKVRQVDMVAVTAEGTSLHGIQWYDEELDVIVRQQVADTAVDELRNIREVDLDDEMFTIPDHYEPVENRLADPDAESTITIETATK